MSARSYPNEGDLVDDADGLGITLGRKVAFLRNPASYPEPQGGVDAIETHMAWVFLTDRQAFKLKKPVRSEDLDFSRLEARRLDCEEEVRLNRRLAPDIYLGILPLTVSVSGDLTLGGPGRTVDWLVKMRRLPAGRMLDRAIADQTVSDNDVRALAALLAAFYGGLEPVDVALGAYGRAFIPEIEASRRSVEALDDPVRLTRYQLVCQRQLSFLAHHAQMLDDRVRDRRIVEGHGDLRPEHVYLDGLPRIIDCLEFSRKLRILDAVDELGYLSLECERLGAAWIGRFLFECYGELTDDRPPAALLAFYKSFRAGVRLRIAIRHMAEPGRLTAAEWLHRADQYLALAERYAVEPAAREELGRNGQLSNSSTSEPPL
jgi:aminoglycoside phosphotransferase family enzyme